LLLLESTSIRIEPLEEESITQTYINSLNDSEYMRHTRHSRVVATYDTQRDYLRQFNKFDAWILKITNLVDGSFVGTLNFYLDLNDRTINLGFLIFKEYQGRGFALRALNVLIEYLEKEFPRFKLVIGTKRSNLQMCRVALAAGFIPVKDLVQELEEDCFYFRNTPEIEEGAKPEIPLILKSAKSIGVAANDAGGAEQLVWLLKALDLPFVALLQGPAIEIFLRSGLIFRSVDAITDLLRSEIVLTGSGWMTNLENTVIENCRRARVPTVTLLDHWVNYESRFGGDKPTKPSMIAVTNSRALAIANRAFPNSSVWLLPDAQLTHYVTVVQESVSRSKVLVLFEPNTTISESLKIDSAVKIELLQKALNMNSAMNLNGVILRLHPSQKAYDQEITTIVANSPEITLSTNKNLLDDLITSKLVVGFSSYALYLAAHSGIDTRSYFKEELEHWTNLVDAISSLEIL
jgi:RimJ/RimL family protein N-acetyltransferase